MNSWTEGYIADIGYTHGYYAELNPLHGHLALINRGYAPPRGNCHCELGFGQGVSINIHAAASGDNWYGTDFNPTQVNFARELASVSGAAVHLYDDAFSEFVKRADLPEFDTISLHGIWSWINDANRALIVDFIKARLKVGGLLYISYNTQPGWSAFSPMRHLLTQHAANMSGPGVGTVNRVESAIEFAEKLLSTKPLYQQATASLVPKLQRIKGQNRQYLAHEYFNRDWHPVYFSEMNDWLTPAKLNYLCSASYADHLDEINVTEEQAKLLANISDPVFREGTRDFIVNQQFRRDLWARGTRQLNASERLQALRSHRVVLIVSRSDVAQTITGSRGEFNVSQPNFNLVLDELADNQPKTLGEIEQVVKGAGMSLEHIVRVALALASSRSVEQAQTPTQIQKAKINTDKFNQHILSKVGSSSQYRYLSSPVTGGGIAVNRINLLFLAAIQAKHSQANDLVNYAWQALKADNQAVLKDGVVLTTQEENVVELLRLVAEFDKKYLPIYRALQMI